MAKQIARPLRRVTRHPSNCCIDKRMRGWIVNTAKRHYWRVAAWYDLDDLIQDGFMCALVCKERYSKARSQRHYMSLVQRTFTNHIHNLAKQRTHQLDIPISSEAAERVINVTAELERLAGHDHGEQVAMTLISQLPVELKMLIHVLLNDDTLSVPMRTRRDGTRETTNEWLCRLVGLKETIDLEALFKQHFGEAA